jgi:hypothetical protein
MVSEKRCGLLPVNRQLNPKKIQPKILNSTPHPFKINLFSFWGFAGEMGI